MEDDLLSGVIDNYYRSPNGQIIRVFAINLQYRSKPETPYFKAFVVKEFFPAKVITQGEIQIPLLNYELSKYKRISNAEIQELRNKENKLEASIQSS